MHAPPTNPELLEALEPTVSSPPARDWALAVRPRADALDTDIILSVASADRINQTNDLARRYQHWPYKIFQDVALDYIYPEGAFSAPYRNAPLADQNIHRAEAFVSLWPEMRAQCQRFLRCVHPALDPRIPFYSASPYRGSSSHSLDSPAGTLWATIYCPLGFALSIVHETAHQKLRTLNVPVEGHAAIIVGNDPQRLYLSPIIKDRLRPMTAVLHAEYSFLHVTELCLRVVRNTESPATRAALLPILRMNLERILLGAAVLRTDFVPGPHGDAFLRGLLDWVDDLLHGTEPILAGAASPHEAKLAKGAT